MLQYSFVAVARTKAIGPGQVKRDVINGRPVPLACVAGRLHAGGDILLQVDSA